MESKFCKDCKFYRKEYFLFAVVGDRCIHPNNHTTDIVTDKSTLRFHPSLLRCDDGNDKKYCGGNARWFQQK